MGGVLGDICFYFDDGLVDCLDLFFRGGRHGPLADIFCVFNHFLVYFGIFCLHFFDPIFKLFYVFFAILQLLFEFLYSLIFLILHFFNPFFPFIQQNNFKIINIFSV